MIDSIRKLFGLKSGFEKLVSDGALILDVRSTEEFQRGHIPGSVNIPVNDLDRNLHKLSPPDKPIITCCKSGVRSGVAKSLLESNGYTNVHNGGGWEKLYTKINPV